MSKIYEHVPGSIEEAVGLLITGHNENLHAIEALKKAGKNRAFRVVALTDMLGYLMFLYVRGNLARTDKLEKELRRQQEVLRYLSEKIQDDKGCGTE